MSTRPDISVIIPCFNAAATLRDTLRCVSSQTHENWEAICIDDESTDQTRELLERYSQADARIRWKRMPHAGLGETRNRALRLARADRVFFLDADDVVDRETLALLLLASEASGDGAVITAGWVPVDENGRRVGTPRYPSVPGNVFDAFLKSNRLLSTALAPAALLGPDPFQRQRACEDWDLWLRLANEGARFVTVPRVLVSYRLRTGSLSHTADLMFANGCATLRRWLPSARDPTGVRDVLHRWACNCGAIAFASGDQEAIGRYFDSLPPLSEFSGGFAIAAAGSIDWALTSCRGARGRSWLSDRIGWLAEIDGWLASGPLACVANEIVARLHQSTINADERASAIVEHVARQKGLTRLLVYGLGTNGLNLIDCLRSDALPSSVQICVADDYASPLTFDLLGLPREDPLSWNVWPTGTMAVATATDFGRMCSVLQRAGGREGVEFHVLVAASSACTGARD